MQKNNIKFLDFTKYVEEQKLYKTIFRYDSELSSKNLDFLPIKKRHPNKHGYQELITFVVDNLK